MAKLTTIEGIGPTLSTKFKKAGVGSTDALLKYCRDSKGRSEIAKATGITPKVVLKFANHADLMRIKGVGGEYSELLEAAGVDTVKELARRDAKALHAKVADVNKKKALVRQLPSEKMVKSWVTSAKRLKPMMTY
jgi:predicted flap endonuclease-1-like 5' DNA nuclease